MECFTLLFDHLAWIEHQFLSVIRDSKKAGSLWGMMREVGGVRKSIHLTWLAKELGLGLGLLCCGFKGVQVEISWEETSTLQIGSVTFLPGQCTSPQLHPCHRQFNQDGHWGDERGCDEGHWHTHTRGLPWGLREVVGTVEQVHCSRRRLFRRGLEFHVCSINKSAHTKKVLKLFLRSTYIYIYIYIYILWECWSSVNHCVVMCRTKCNIIWRVLNIYDKAIIIIMIINKYILYIYLILGKYCSAT